MMPFVNYMDGADEDDAIELPSPSGTDIMHMNVDTLTVILRGLSPENVCNFTMSCKEMNVRFPKTSALAEWYRTRYGNLIRALFAVDPDADVADGIMDSLVRGARLEESDGPVLLEEIEMRSDARTARVIGVLRRVPGFALCMISARSDFYASPLVCACLGEKPLSTEVILDVPETDVSIIVDNGIVSAPLLHWLFVKWNIDDMKQDAAKKRIVRSILKRPDLDLARPWKMSFGTRKPFEILWERTLPGEKDDLEAKAELLRVLDT
jgi:hypothetical protein